MNLTSYRPYLVLSICGLLAFAPVSFMIFSLKNDVVALEYPINQFMSNCIRHGEWPYWFNSWGMGFPLQSTVTWGVFSTPRMLFSSVFNYDIYALHIEFMFYILLAGWGMYYLLNRFLARDPFISLVLAMAYMLSGFMSGSSQWLLYLTGAAYIPVMISSLLHFFERPSARYAIQVAIVYTIMFTSVYAAFNIISTYLILAMVVIALVKLKEDRTRLLKYLGLSALIILVLCLPILYFSLEVLKNMERGIAINASTNFFQSNYLHPLALKNLLLPLSSIRMSYPNTEGTMLHSYMGIAVLLFLPFSIRTAFVKRDTLSIVLLGLSLFFLFTAFGHLLPLRNSLNILPGFSYFRHPAIFRYYFILFLILFLAASLREIHFSELTRNVSVRVTAFLLLLISLVVLFMNFPSPVKWMNSSLLIEIHSIDARQLTGISALLQAGLLIAILLAIFQRSRALFTILISADLILNTLLCLPFFGVSSYSPSAVNKILTIRSGFPIQASYPSDVPAVFADKKGNEWQNVNIFSGEVSSNDSYKGPLELAQAKPGRKNSPLVFAPFDSLVSIAITTQRPTHIQAKVTSAGNCLITLAQNNYSGWYAKVNGRKEPIIGQNDQKLSDPPTGITIAVPAGESTIDFIYERKELKYFCLLLHFLILSWLLWKLTAAIKNITRSSSLS